MDEKLWNIYDEKLEKQLSAAASWLSWLLL